MAHTISTLSSTARAGIAQAQAYRKLRKFFSGQLKQEQLTMMDWSVLGLIEESGKITPTKLATELSVAAPLVTKLTKKLTAEGYIKIELDPDDSRTRILSLSPQGKITTKTLETKLRQVMREWLSEVEPLHLAVYLKVLDQIANLDVPE